MEKKFIFGLVTATGYEPFTRSTHDLVVVGE